jgi:NADH-quinone oxidoreductase subunit H
VPPWLIFIAKTHLFYFLFIWTRGTLPRLRVDQLMTFAWKFMLPVALINLFVVATQRLIWAEYELGDWVVYPFALFNIAVAIGVIVAWARLLGYRPEDTPKRARLVNEAGGYVPVEPGVRGGR